MCSSNFSSSSRRPDRAADAVRSRSSEDGGDGTRSSSEIVRRSRFRPGAVRAGGRDRRLSSSRSTGGAAELVRAGSSRQLGFLTACALALAVAFALTGALFRAVESFSWQPRAGARLASLVEPRPSRVARAGLWPCGRPSWRLCAQSCVRRRFSLPRLVLGCRCDPWQPASDPSLVRPSVWPSRGPSNLDSCR